MPKPAQNKAFQTAAQPAPDTAPALQTGESAVQPVLRALDILRVLNEKNPASLAFMHERTGLPKPTLVRLLQTLIAAGYVEQLSRRHGYRLTQEVLQLARGFRFDHHVVEVARPYMDAFTRIHKWPVAIATLEGARMHVHYGTQGLSPFSYDADVKRPNRIPVLQAALGRAYLAYCPKDERDVLLRLLRQSGHAADREAKDKNFIARLISEIHAKGYATMATVPGETANGIAVPIMKGDAVLAAITLRFYDSAMSEQEAATRYAAPLHEMAKQIAAAA